MLVVVEVGVVVLTGVGVVVLTGVVVVVGERGVVALTGIVVAGVVGATRMTVVKGVDIAGSSLAGIEVTLGSGRSGIAAVSFSDADISDSDSSNSVPRSAKSLSLQAASRKDIATATPKNDLLISLPS